MNIIPALIYKSVFPILLVFSVLAGHAQTNYFRHYQVENGLSNNSVLCSTQDKMGFMWFGTKDGLSRFDGHYFKVFRKTNKPGSIGNNFVHAIQEDAAGNLWLGTERGVYKYTTLTETFSVIKGTEKTGVSEIICDTKGDCWFTAGTGLMHYKPATQTLSVFEPGKYFEATGVCETPDHNIWISTAKGQLKRYDALKDTFTTFDLFKENETVNSRWIERITALDDGRILAGTSVAGLKVFDIRTGKCAGINLDKKQKDVFIHNFLQTPANECWIGTEYGVYILNWQTGKSINLSKKYNDPYAISDNAVYAFCKDREGGIWVGTYFGGVNYYPRFQPADFYRSDLVPPLFITGFQVNNEELEISDKKGVIDRSISHTAAITLAHNQSTFSIDFAALSFAAPEMQEYAYQLVGVDKQWTHIKGNRRIYYTDLSPGKYVFKVKAASNSGTWNALEKQLTIEIRRPWWTSAPAYLSYSLLVILGIVYVIKSYNRWQAEKNKRRLELLQIAREKEILQAKIEFFTNVAHEIKTPLTLIKVPLAKVIKKTKGIIPEVENSLRIMDKNTNRLLELTQQLLDFRQTEINQFRLSFVRSNISELVEDANKSFSSLAEQNNIILQLNLPPAPVYAYVDAEAFNKVIYNLYSNAVKYAGTRASITVQPITNDDTLFFVLFKNDGHLIPDSQREKIFQPFYRIRKTDHQPGTGIGLALALSLTELHRGSLALKPSSDNMNIFELSLPIHQDLEFNLKNTPYI